MLTNKTWTFRRVLYVLLSVAFVLYVHRAVPFMMMPVFLQSVWAMGFAQSYANGALFNFYAHDFGVPNPAAIAFGLAGAWPASLLIRLGLHPADAYSAMVALWLGLAMFSAYRIGRFFGAVRTIALLGGVVWMTMPVVWGHAGYSMLSLGIALLSFYFLTACRLFQVEGEEARITFGAVVLYFAACIVSVFMDGYTFIMFATGSSIFLIYLLVIRPNIRRKLLMTVVPIHVMSFGFAYILFSFFIGNSEFSGHSIDFFRSMGLDLSFIVIPTTGDLWLADLLGLSMRRTDEIYFGDASVWSTTFALPVILLALVAWCQIRRTVTSANGFILVAGFAFYMALGPSLKINSTKPESLRHIQPNYSMSSEFAVMPTGNEWISKTLPGFKVMRASYRWSALYIFAIWLIIMLCASRSKTSVSRIWIICFLVLTLCNLPDLQKRLRGADLRDMFYQIDKDVISVLRHYVRPAEKVAFIPWGNDFFANYIAPRAGFRTFNIGGDKNVEMAKVGWPSEFISLNNNIDSHSSLIAAKMLITGTADVLVFPYFDLHLSSHSWPCPEQNLKIRKEQLQSAILALRDLPYIDVMESTLFATARLRPEFSGEANRSTLLNALFKQIDYPIVFGRGTDDNELVLEEGWHSVEMHHVWSNAAAQLMLPIPEGCKDIECDAVLKFAVFGASLQRPVSVVFEIKEKGWEWNEKVIVSSRDVFEARVPLRGVTGSRLLSISIPDATSPQLLNGSSDSRILGIAIQRIDLMRHPKFLIE